MDIIRLLEWAFGIAQCEADAVTLIDEMVEVLSFPRKRLLQEPE